MYKSICKKILGFIAYSKIEGLKAAHLDTYR